MKLSKAQERALVKLTDKPQSAYDIGESLATLKALVKKGYVKDVTKPGPGGMFSPTTHYKFVRGEAV